MRTPRISMMSLALACFACNGSSDSPAAPPPALSRIDVEPPGANCAAGGQAVRTGLDEDGNGALDDGEVTSVRYLCAEPARTLLVRSRAEPAGEHCTSGGTAVLAGVDRDGDGTLADAEVDQTTYVCTDALPPVLVTTSALAPDATCPAGRTEVASGPDRNRSGVLDADEVEQRQTVCGAGVLVKTDRVWDAPGCSTHDGTRVRSGADVDGDGVLADGEVTATTYVCSPVSYGFVVRTQADLDYLTQRVNVVRGDLFVESATLAKVSIGGGLVVTGSIRVRDCPALTELGIWPAMVGRDIEVSQTPALTTLSIDLYPGSAPSLPVLGNLTVSDAPQLKYLFMDEVPSIQGSFTLRRTGVETVSMESTRSGLDTIGGDLVIEQCDGLRYLEARYLTRVGGALAIRGNTAPWDDGRLSLRLISVGERVPYGADLDIADNTALGVVVLDQLVTVTGDVFIGRNAGLGLVLHGALASVGGDYYAIGNPDMTNLGGWSPDSTRLTIDGTVWVEDNASLFGMGGMNQLARAGSVYVRKNPRLEYLDLARLGSAQSIVIEKNDALAFLGPGPLPVTDLDALTQLTACDSLSVVDNPTLSRLQLPLLTHVGNLVVKGNPQVPTCQVQAIVSRSAPTYTVISGTDDAGICP